MIDLTTQDGVVLDMPNVEYHGRPGLSSTGLKLLAQSPAHYWAAYLDPDREQRQSTPAQRIGQMVHTATLEPHKLEETLIVMPEGLDRRTKEGKELWAQIVASGKEPVNHVDFARVGRMAAALHAHPMTRLLFDDFKAATEVSMFWTDPYTNVLCKIRPDILVPPCDELPNGLIADVKTTEDASPDAFAKHAWNMEMYYQAALYPEGFMAIFGTNEPPEFLWIAQEKETPYANAYYICGRDLYEYGRRKINHLRAVYAACLMSDKWPGYSRDINTLAVPGFAQKIVENAIK